jgi:hypothetical protein
MANSKMTKRDYFGMLKEVVKGNENESELIAFIDHEIELLAKKHSSSKSSKKQVENEGIMLEICNALGMVGKPVTVTELQKAIPEMAELSNQKISALLKKLVDNGEVIKTIDKKKSYFSLADTDTDEDTDVEVEEE